VGQKQVAPGMSGSQRDCNPTSHIKFYVQHGTITEVHSEVLEIGTEYESKKD
jgi:hypothetical protein